MRLTEQQTFWLKWLHDNGGSGFLDTYGRVIASGANSHQTSQTAWLNLFVKGMVCAREGRIVLTEQGLSLLTWGPVTSRAGDRVIEGKPGDDRG